MTEPGVATDGSSRETSYSAEIQSWLRHGVFLAAGAAVLYRLWPNLLGIVSTAPRLSTIRPSWFLVMVAAEIASFACVWWLLRILLPRTSWLAVSTSQLVANAVSRTVPGGAALGGATMYRMLVVSGTAPTQAAGALAVTSILSTAAIFAIPALALLMAIIGAPIPEALEPAAVAGAVLFVLLVLVGYVAISRDRPLLAVGGLLQKGAASLPRRFRRTITPAQLLVERNRLVGVVGDRWGQAMAAAALNWVFDYLALVAALYGVGADPRLSLVLLAYAGVVVTSMIPITPGGFGFVEPALVSMLVLSGISTQNAGLATLAYRIVSLLLPVCAALPAWLAYRLRFRSADFEAALPRANRNQGSEADRSSVEAM